MGPKSVNRLFFFSLVLEAAVTILLILAGDSISLSLPVSLLLSQLIVFLPAAGCLLVTRTSPRSLIAWNRPRISVSLLVIAFTYLCMPAVLAINAISMLFVENEVSGLQQYMYGIPAWLLLLIIGIIGPANEEFVFRGVIYHGYRRSGRIAVAMLLSALLFGLTHLNFNQMSYAVFVGIVGVLLIEGTGSIFYSFLFHAVINITNVIEMLLAGSETTAMTQAQREAYIQETMNMPYRQALCVAASVYLVIACVTLAIAACLFALILRLSGRTEHFKSIFCRKSRAEGEKRERLVTPILILSIVLCLAYMTADVIMG